MSPQQLQRWQRLIVLAHLLLAVAYGVVVPPYEAHDETGHFAYIQHVLSTGTLPSPRAADKAFLDQSHQPPAYYVITAAAIAFTDRSDYARPERNVFAFDGSNRRGVRILLRQAGEDFPWRGSVLALHLARMVSALMSALMLLAIAATARLVFAESPASALLATAIAAFNPQVLFMAAMVNNDVMVSLCGAAIALQLTRIAHAPAPGTRAFVALGLALGLSLASKNSALVLLPFVAAALGFIAWRTRWARGATLRHALTTGLATALIAAPHFARNRLVEGKWLLDRTTDAVDTLTTAGVFGAGLNQALIDAWLPRIFINAFRTFWGAFGWGNVQQPEAAYTVFAVLCALAVMGALLGWRRAAPPTRTVLSVLLGLGVAILLLPTYRAIAYQDPALLPGRYLMPALSGYAVLLAFGLQRIFGAKPAATFALAAAAALWAALVPITVIAPRYRAQITAPAKNDAVILRFGDVAEITQVTAETLYLQDREGPRQYARVRLTWRALRATAEPFAAAITVVGFDAEPLGSVVVHPQRGNYPSTIWTPGATFTDEYDVLLQKPCARLPALGRIDVALIATTTDAITGEVRCRRAAACDGQRRHSSHADHRPLQN